MSPLSQNREYPSGPPGSAGVLVLDGPGLQQSAAAAAMSSSKLLMKDGKYAWCPTSGALGTAQQYPINSALYNAMPASRSKGLYYSRAAVVAARDSSGAGTTPASSAPLHKKMVTHSSSKPKVTKADAILKLATHSGSKPKVTEADAILKLATHSGSKPKVTKADAILGVNLHVMVGSQVQTTGSQSAGHKVFSSQLLGQGAHVNRPLARSANAGYTGGGMNSNRDGVGFSNGGNLRGLLHARSISSRPESAKRRSSEGPLADEGEGYTYAHGHSQAHSHLTSSYEGASSLPPVASAHAVRHTMPVSHGEATQDPSGKQLQAAVALAKSKAKPYQVSHKGYQNPHRQPMVLQHHSFPAATIGPGASVGTWQPKAYYPNSMLIPTAFSTPFEKSHNPVLRTATPPAPGSLLLGSGGKLQATSGAKPQMYSDMALMPTNGAKPEMYSEMALLPTSNAQQRTGTAPHIKAQQQHSRLSMISTASAMPTASLHFAARSQSEDLSDSQSEDLSVNGAEFSFVFPGAPSTMLPPASSSGSRPSGAEASQAILAHPPKTPFYNKKAKGPLPVLRPQDLLPKLVSEPNDPRPVTPSSIHHSLSASSRSEEQSNPGDENSKFHVHQGLRQAQTPPLPASLAAQAGIPPMPARTPMYARKSVPHHPIPAAYTRKPPSAPEGGAAPLKPSTMAEKQASGDRVAETVATSASKASGGLWEPGNSAKADAADSCPCDSSDQQCLLPPNVVVDLADALRDKSNRGDADSVVGSLSLSQGTSLHGELLPIGEDQASDRCSSSAQHDAFAAGNLSPAAHGVPRLPLGCLHSQTSTASSGTGHEVDSMLDSLLGCLPERTATPASHQNSVRTGTPSMSNLSRPSTMQGERPVDGQITQGASLVNLSRPPTRQPPPTPSGAAAYREGLPPSRQQGTAGADPLLTSTACNDPDVDVFGNVSKPSSALQREIVGYSDSSQDNSDAEMNPFSEDDDDFDDEGGLELSSGGESDVEVEHQSQGGGKSRSQSVSQINALGDSNSSLNLNAINDQVVDGIRLLGQKYEVQQLVGEGAYGMVTKCKVQGTDRYVAIKEFKIEDDDPDADDVKRTSKRELELLRCLNHPNDDDPDAADVKRTSKRELELLRCLNHPNVVQLVDEFFVKDHLFIVMEFVPCNLLELLEAQPGGMDKDAIRLIMFQLCTAMSFIHSRDVVFRDIKPENVLVDERGRLKLCDFGFARFTNKGDDPLTDYVATRWYRAPELLLGPPYRVSASPEAPRIQCMYGPEVDMWAIGCVLGELTDGEPLFAGDSDLDQLYKIQQCLGSMASEHQDIFNGNPHNMGIVFNIKQPLTLTNRYMGRLSEVELDFLSGLLHMDPQERLTAEQCLAHPYLADLVAAESKSRSGSVASSSSTSIDSQHQHRQSAPASASSASSQHWPSSIGGASAQLPPISVGHTQGSSGGGVGGSHASGLPTGSVKVSPLVSGLLTSASPVGTTTGGSGPRRISHSRPSDQGERRYAHGPEPLSPMPILESSCSGSGWASQSLKPSGGGVDWANQSVRGPPCEGGPAPLSGGDKTEGSARSASRPTHGTSGRRSAILSSSTKPTPSEVAAGGEEAGPGVAAPIKENSLEGEGGVVGGDDASSAEQLAGLDAAAAPAPPEASKAGGDEAESEADGAKPPSASNSGSGKPAAAPDAAEPPAASKAGGDEAESEADAFERESAPGASELQAGADEASSESPTDAVEAVESVEAIESVEAASENPTEAVESVKAASENPAEAPADLSKSDEACRATPDPGSSPGPAGWEAAHANEGSEASHGGAAEFEVSQGPEAAEFEASHGGAAECEASQGTEAAEFEASQGPDGAPSASGAAQLDMSQEAFPGFGVSASRVHSPMPVTVDKRYSDGAA
eukprot:gene7666-822_t